MPATDATAARILCFHKGGRDRRRGLVEAGEAPRDFFYGFLAVEADGIAVDWLSTAEAYPGAGGRAARRIELVHAALTGTAWRPYYFRAVAPRLAQAALALSFTDHFSLSLGRWGWRRPRPPRLVGLFHGLSDIEADAPAPARPYVRWYIRRAAAGLDRIGFLGEADRANAVRRYGLDAAKTFVFGFGVDERFWRPGAAGAVHDGTVLAVGSDRNRDYATLLRALPQQRLRIVSDLPIAVPPGAPVEVLRGNFEGLAVDDAALRDLYRTALCVVVPLRDCWQPSGQSVTLQAMACGAAVVLTRNRGLWAPEQLRHDENCLLVPPGDAGALAAAVARLAAVPALCDRLGHAARRTVERHFPLAVAEAAARSIAAPAVPIPTQLARVVAGSAA